MHVENFSVYRRNYGYSLYNAGFDGAFPWAYQGAFGKMWTDNDDSVRDHMATYPTSTGVIDTIQWEGMREAVDDTRYAATLTTLNHGNNTTTNLLIANGLTAGNTSQEIREQLIEYIGYGAETNPPTVAFSCTPLSGARPLSVTCTDASTDLPDTWFWYNNTTVVSTLRNPTFSIATTGAQTIRLNSSNSAGYNWSNKTAYIDVTPKIPVAGFTSSVTTLLSTNYVTLTDTSTGSPTNWDWYWFTNETKSSDDQSPTATWPPGTGTYNVRLYASNVDGGSWRNQTVTVPKTKESTTADFQTDNTIFTTIVALIFIIALIIGIGIAILYVRGIENGNMPPIELAVGYIVGLLVLVVIYLMMTGIAYIGEV